MREEIRNWWLQALSDFDKAKVLFEANKYDGVVVFAQQAAEVILHWVEKKIQ